MSKNIESTMRMMENRGKNYQDSEEDTVLNYKEGGANMSKTILYCNKN